METRTSQIRWSPQGHNSHFEQDMADHVYMHEEGERGDDGESESETEEERWHSETEKRSDCWWMTVGCLPPVLLLLLPCASAGYAMRRRKRGPRLWNPPFAHRECIQRWCDEKGSNVCEICLQKFEPGYTIPEKKASVDVGVTIRGSLEVPRLNYDPHNPEFISDNNSDFECAEVSPASRRHASYIRSIALMFMIVLVIRNLIAVITVGADHYASTILTVFLMRASGILLPFYLVMRFVSALQEARQQDQLQQFHIVDAWTIHRLEEEDHRIQIPS
ncbi:hypothetical protein MUK42_00738 [Musa troglodytarum]|uniref:RING-CH-type domain-containing protein n=1 Tax=Musa troglodytarum TaxID=320322 RepID=A0A9E7FCG0_9LILI|nr:hypothetical protein MUK42_00738 [Musa troglodytarum]